MTSNQNRTTTTEWCEYHPKPGPHFSMASETWERLKAHTAADTVEGSHIAGQVGTWAQGTPVYLDGCPWDCGNGSGEPPLCICGHAKADHIDRMDDCTTGGCPCPLYSLGSGSDEATP